MTEPTTEELWETVRAALVDLAPFAPSVSEHAGRALTLLETRMKEMDPERGKTYRENQRKVIVALRAQRDEAVEWLREMPRCQARDSDSHAIPKDPKQRAWCLKCVEWCYPDEGCAGCRVRTFLANLTTEGEGQ